MFSHTDSMLSSHLSSQSSVWRDSRVNTVGHSVGDTTAHFSSRIAVVLRLVVVEAQCVVTDIPAQVERGTQFDPSSRTSSKRGAFFILGHGGAGTLLCWIQLSLARCRILLGVEESTQHGYSNGRRFLA